jgi:uncharacterized membrane protein (UPF0127 family)
MSPSKLAAIAAVSLALAAGPGWAQGCSPGVADIRDPDTKLRFNVEVMDTPEGRARGLMFREDLPRFSGMLFVYDEAGPVAFWMENTLIPLDMLFFDESGQLVRIHENAVPLDRTSIFGGENIRYVLEINGGQARELGIDTGAEIQHPAIVQDGAAWPCAGE